MSNTHLENDQRKRQREEDQESRQHKRRKDDEPMQVDVKENTPKDLEVLLQQTKVESTAKARFLTKEERTALARKKREEEVAVMKAKQEEERKAREEFFQQAKQQERDKRDDKRSELRKPEDRRMERKTEKREEKREEKKGATEPDHLPEEKLKEKEREETKKAYLGIKEQKKRFNKPSEKYRFVFEWDKSEDTSADLNPLYSSRVEARPQFGRGYIGGIDKKEQLQKYQENVKDKMALDKTETTLHWSQKKLSQMTSRDWRILKEDFGITTKGGALPNPIRSWQDSGLPSWILKAVAEAKYERPTPVQMQAIPVGLSGRDILGVAQTGSGKTCAFVLPMLVYISNQPKMTRETEIDGPYAVILAPTRELATQIAQEAERFAKHGGYRVVLVVGGSSIDEQAINLRKGCEIVVATPGRLNDCLENHYVVLNQCNYVVLDEADRMVDMGFEPQVISILDSMPQDTLKSEVEEEAAEQERDFRNQYRTTLMFSATMPPEVERLSKRYLRRPGIIYIGEAGKAVDRIKQEVYWVTNETEKRRRLQSLLKEGPKPPIIIFANQRKTCDAVAKFISGLGYKCTTLQGGRSQDQRDWALQEFKEGRSEILVATDVAGRGLDVKGVTHVINFDVPKTIEQYTHRIGRTGRAGATGLASSFIGNEDVEIMFYLKKMLQESGAHIPQELRDHPDAQLKPGAVVQKSRKETVIFTS